MRERMIQLVARYIGVGLLAVAGWLLGEEPSAEQAQAIQAGSMALAVAVGGLISLGVDLFLHRLGAGSVMTPAGQKKG